MSLHQRVRAELRGRLEPLALQQRGEFLLERVVGHAVLLLIGAGGNPYHAAGCSCYMWSSARCVGGEEL